MDGLPGLDGCNGTDGAPGPPGDIGPAGLKVGDIASLVRELKVNCPNAVCSPLNEKIYITLHGTSGSSKRY